MGHRERSFKVKFKDDSEGRHLSALEEFRGRVGHPDWADVIRQLVERGLRCENGHKPPGT